MDVDLGAEDRVVSLAVSGRIVVQVGTAVLAEGKGLTVSS